VGGFNQKQPVLLSAILSQLRSLRAVDKPADFARLKESMKRRLLNFKLDNPYQHALWDENMALEQNVWTHGEKLAVIDTLTPAMVDNYSVGLLEAAEIEMMMHGNVVEEEVRATAVQVQRALNFAPLFASQLSRSRVVQLSPKKSYLLQRASLNPTPAGDPNSATLNLYQLGENSVELHAVAELFAHIVRQPLYDQLRTKEQLGYLVWSNLVNTKGVLGWRVLIQSSSAGADYVNYRTEAFLEWFRQTELTAKLADPSLRFFQTNVDAVVAKKLEKDKTLSAETTRLWHEIVTQRLQFDRVEREVAALRALDPTHLLSFIDRYISITGPAEGDSQRAKLSIQYFGKGKDIPEPVLRETDEQVAFANEPLPSDKAAAPDAVAAAAAAVAAPAAGVSQAAEGASEASASPPPVGKADVLLPRVPVDPREIEMIEDDLGEFKNRMPLFPSFQ
jgi:insulysin